MKLPIPSYPGLTPADLRAQCGYAHPPPELELPHFREDPDGMAYVALREWFRRQGVDEYDGLACYLAHKFSVDLDAAEGLREEYEGNVYQSYN